MAASAARADIASTSYVNAQIQPVQTALESKQDVSNMVVAISGDDYEDAKGSTELYPSMATADQLIRDVTSQLGVSGKQDRSSSNYSMGNQSGGWTAMTEAQQNALNSGATSALVGKISTNESAISSLNSTVSGHTSSISQLGTDISTLNSGKQEKSDSTVTGTHTYITSNEKVGANLAALDTALGTLSDTVTNATTGLAATRTLAQKGVDDAATAQSKADTNETAISGINTKIGTVPSGKTVVGMIEDAQTAATYDDTALAGRVTAVEGDVTTLKGTGNGSVAKAIADALTDYTKTGLDSTYATATALTTHTGNADIHVTTADKAAWNAKQNALTFDNVPTEDSANPVKSGGVYTALAAKADSSDLASYELKANVTTKGDATHPVYFDANGVAQQITSYAGNAATATSAASADAVAWSGVTGTPTTLAGYGITDAQGTLTFDNAPTENSANPVKSGGVYTALAGKQATISDLSTIRSNATAGKGASDTIATYGDVVTHNAADFAAAGNYITVPVAAPNTSGKSVLTYDADTTTYYWEDIGR